MFLRSTTGTGHENPTMRWQRHSGGQAKLPEVGIAGYPPASLRETFCTALLIQNPPAQLRNTKAVNALLPLAQRHVGVCVMRER